MGSFIKSSDYKKVKKLFEDGDGNGPRLVIVYGVSGRGKTQIGDELARELPPGYHPMIINSNSNEQFRNSLQAIVNDLKRTKWPIEHGAPLNSLKEICERFNDEGTNCFLNFDNLPSTDAQDDSNWRGIFQNELNSVNLPSLQKSKFLIMITTQGELTDLEFGKIEVRRHKMEGFDGDDTREFLNKIFVNKIPDFWGDDNVAIDKLKKKLSRLPSAYKAATPYIKSMCDQDELDDLDPYDDNEIIIRIEEKLQKLPHLETWKLLTIYSEGLMIPKEYFLIIISRQILNIKDGNLQKSDEQLLKTARGVYAEMLDTYERHGFVTTHRSNTYRETRPTDDSTRSRNTIDDSTTRPPRHTSEQMYISIQDLAMKALKGLTDGEEKLNAVQAGLLALSKLLLKDDRHHKKTKRAPGYIPALTSLASLLYETVNQHLRKSDKDNIFTRLTNCELLMYYEIISAIYYHKLRKEVVGITQRDLEFVARSLKDLESTLSPQQRDDGPEPMEIGAVPTMPEEDRYKEMMGYLKGPDVEALRNMRKILHLTERDIRTIQGQLTEEEDMVAVKPHGQDLLALSETQYRKWEEKKVLLSLETVQKTYPLEVLSGMYMTLGKMKSELSSNDSSQGGDNLVSKPPHAHFEKAANILKVARPEEEKGILELLERIIVNRDNLLDEEFQGIKRTLPNGDIQADGQMKSLEGLEKEYKELMMLEELAYEHGLLRSNMKKDYYNKLICCEMRMRILVLMIQKSSGNEQRANELVDEFCNAYQGIPDPQTETPHGIRHFAVNELYPKSPVTSPNEDISDPTNRRAYAFTLRAIGGMLGRLCPRATLKRVSYRYFTMCLKIIHPDPETQVTDNAIRKLCEKMKEVQDIPRSRDGLVQKIEDTFDICICYEEKKLKNPERTSPCESCQADKLMEYLNKFQLDDMNESMKEGITSLKRMLS